MKTSLANCSYKDSTFFEQSVFHSFCKDDETHKSINYHPGWRKDEHDLKKTEIIIITKSVWRPSCKGKLIESRRLAWMPF